MPLTEIERRIVDTLGLDPAALGRDALDSAIRHRMAQSGIPEEAAYQEFLRQTPEEFQALLETVVIPESFFFRDHETFAFLARIVRSRLHSPEPPPLLRILSVPCAGGEEPCSIAMVLIEAGWAAGTYRIDAYDISRILLRKAREGIYSPNAFRGPDLAYRARYFTAVGTSYQLHPLVHNGIRFEQGNILDDHFLLHEPPYDLVFCRNLMIYLNAPARQKVIAQLNRLVKPGGWLFVGHAEMLPALSAGFGSLLHPGAFVYQKKDPSHQIAPPPAPIVLPNCAQPSPRRIIPNQLEQIIPLAAEPAVPPPRAALERARQLADEGHLQEAAALCEQTMQTTGPSARLYGLLGIIMDAAGQPQRAEDCLNRAIYLDADYYDAILHLSLLKARRGDSTGAATLRQRAARIHKLQQVPA